MEFLGVGPLELFFILIIALIFLGPRDMVKTGRTIGKFMRKVVMSPTWRMVQQTSRELRTLPNRMIREAGMEEDIQDLNVLRKDMEKQIGAMSKPFSAAAGEVNAELQAAKSGVQAESGAAEAVETKPDEQPAAATQPGEGIDLTAWTTAPAAAKPMDSAEAAPGSGSTGASQAGSAPVENPNPDAT